MKKISQAIIGATLILDVAVVFTFGLAVISSFEDGSRLPETTFVRKAPAGRVAGEASTLQINIIDLYDQITLNSPITVKARTTVALPIGHTVYFNVKNNLVNSSGYTSAALVPGTILDWQKEMNMPVGSYSIFAEARSSSGSVLAVSPIITINISDNNASISVPSVTLNNPSGGTISGIKEISGTLSNFSSSYSMPTKELQVWQGSTWKKNFPLTRGANNQSNLIGSMDTGTLLGGDYSLKIHIMYNDGTADKPLDSALTNVTVSNANTSGGSGSGTTVTAPSITLNSPASGTISGIKEISGTLSNFSSSYSIPIKELQAWQGTTFKKSFPLTRDANNLIGSMDTNTLLGGDYSLKIHIMYNDGAADKPLDSALTNVTVSNASATSGSTGSTSTDTSSPSGTGTSGSTDTTSPPPTDTTAATMIVAMTNPAPSTIPTILRSRDNPLAAKTSTAVSGLKFIVHKSDEPADWVTPINAASADKINWTGNWNLADFKDGAYDIMSVSGDIKSKPVNVIVQKFSFKWLTPNKGDELSKKVALKSEINGIYGTDNKTPMNDMVVEFWQFSVASSYPPKYIGRAQKKPDSHEWFYEWNTIDSPLGECRLEVRIGNAAYNTTKGSLYNTDPLSVKVSSQISSALSGSSNSNTSQNSNTPPSVNSNTTNANKAVNSAINSSVTLNQNANTAAGSNSNLNLAQDSLNINLSTDNAVSLQTDSDNDKLSDEKEAKLGTNPNSNDTDGDGLFDREEAEVHGTNPLNVDTDGDGYNDFEEIQSGHDPLKSSTDTTASALLKSKPVEEPKTAGVIAKDILAVEDVYTPIKEPAKIANDNNNSLTSGTVSGSEPLIQEQESKIILKGKGPANTILTLFIYSNDPIVVTVRTNENGEWIYELDKTLEDGEHEVYATITDDTGKIESKSSPMRFLVKQARAETIPERADTGVDSIPGSSSTNLYLLISGIMVFVAIVAGFIIALRRKRGDTNQIM